MKIKNAQYWDSIKANNQDSYSKTILRFAERWADLIEEAISESEGKTTVAEVARSAFLIASDEHGGRTEHIRSEAIKMAVGILNNAWKHGEDLWRWYYRFDF